MAIISTPARFNLVRLARDSTSIILFGIVYKSRNRRYSLFTTKYENYNSNNNKMKYKNKRKKYKYKRRKLEMVESNIFMPLSRGRANATQSVDSFPS